MPGMADLDRDGMTDLLFQYAGTGGSTPYGQVYYWTLGFSGGAPAIIGQNTLLNASSDKLVAPR